MSVTPLAAEKVKALIDGREKPTVGIRIGVRSKGCSGMSYDMSWVDEPGPTDEVVTSAGLTELYGHHVDVVRVHGRVLVVAGD